MTGLAVVRIANSINEQMKIGNWQCASLKKLFAQTKSQLVLPSSLVLVLALATTSFSQHEGHKPPQPPPKQQRGSAKPSPTPASTPAPAPSPAPDNKPAQPSHPVEHKQTATPQPTPGEGHQHVTPPAAPATPEAERADTKHPADHGAGLLLMTEKEMGIRIGSSSPIFSRWAKWLQALRGIPHRRRCTCITSNPATGC